ncbi:MAG: DUF4301 family protein [Bacteroidota bacterium]
MIDLTEKDLQQLAEKGISKDKITNQINTFKEGIPFINLKKAAVVGDGISRYTQAEQQDLITFFDTHKTALSLLKFVPASGAASRMFKAMFNFLETYSPDQESLDSYIAQAGDKAVAQFVEDIKSLPFYAEIMKRIAEKYNSEGEKVYQFVQTMLLEEGLNYGFYPKGLLLFHKYADGVATPFEEHLKEASSYSKTMGKAQLHFTISVQHEELFGGEEAKVAPKIAENTNTLFEISYSNQKPSTDTLAVTMENAPFRNSDGTLLFRPGGHGALIENLNDQEADVIFIKNIDNVVVDANLEDVADSKKMLAGVLLKMQSEAFGYAKALAEDDVTSDLLNAVKVFLEQRLNVRFPENYDSFAVNDQVAILKDKINRPIRICGMVKNEGEPGGGPFWIKDKNGNVSLQIIESAQIDMQDKDQVAILKHSTHFNPVDLVCGVKNYKGEKYQLLNFIDERQGFITEKTKEGKVLKALELPGLWNGAMAFWNTIFVEVPLVTFNPVKTVNDLLKSSHQP